MTVAAAAGIELMDARDGLEVHANESKTFAKRDQGNGHPQVVVLCSSCAGCRAGRQ